MEAGLDSIDSFDSSDPPYLKIGFEFEHCNLGFMIWDLDNLILELERLNGPFKSWKLHMGRDDRTEPRT